MTLRALPLFSEAVKARSRRTGYVPPKVKPPRESALHGAVARTLRRYARPDWRWTHFPAGGERTPRAGARMRAMGLQRGWPDFLLVSPLVPTAGAAALPARLHALELKREGEAPSDDQIAFAAWCSDNGVPHEVCWSLAQVLAVLDRWACLRIRAGVTA